MNAFCSQFCDNYSNVIIISQKNFNINFSTTSFIFKNITRISTQSLTKRPLIEVSPTPTTPEMQPNQRKPDFTTIVFHIES